MRPDDGAPRPATSRWRAIAAGLALLLTASWLAAPTASAHVTLVSSSPAEGEQVTAVPAGITLTFSGELEPVGQITVTDPNGLPLHAGTTIVSGDAMIQRVSDQGGALGSYTVDYAATSTDGHPIEGTVRFTVGAAAVPGTDPVQAPAAIIRDDAATGSDDESESGFPFLLGGGLVVAALALAGGALWWFRSRRPVPAAPARPVPPRARTTNKKAAAGSRNRR